MNSIDWVRLPCFATAVMVLGAGSGAALAAEPTIRAGVASVDITPPPGLPLAGYYHERGAEGTLDPLHSRALVFESGGERFAFVTLDLIATTRWLTDRARAEIERACAIPAHRVMLSATHAHTGPELAHRGKRSEGLGAQRPAIVEYTESLPTRIADTVQQALERLQPVRVTTALGRCEGLTFNRRFFMRDGSVGWNPGKLNPDIVRPAGPTDPVVGVLYVEPAEGRSPAQALATYVNFAMHPDTCGGSKYSADWPGALARVLAAYHGPHHVTLLANGACGNLNHFDVSWAWPNSWSNEQHRIATLLGASVFQAYKDLKPVSPAPLRAKSQTVELDLPDVSSAQIDEARRTVESIKDDRGPNFMKLVRAYRTLDVAARDGQPHRVEVQAVALGREVAWISLPGEVFVELGLALKQQSPFPVTFVVELANENLGYIPDRRSYAEGNYEPESARCAPGSGEKLVAAAASLLLDLHGDPPGSANP